MARFTYWQKDHESEPELVSVSTAKKLLRQQGGSAYTMHTDRDGGIQEVTPIVSGNNANTTYRAKYNTSKCYRK